MAERVKLLPKYLRGPKFSKPGFNSNSWKWSRWAQFNQWLLKHGGLRPETRALLNTAKVHKLLSQEDRDIEAKRLRYMRGVLRKKGVARKWHHAFREDSIPYRFVMEHQK